MQPIKRRYWSKMKVPLAILLAGILVIVGWKLVSWGQRFKKETGLSATTIAQLIFNGGAPLAASDGRTNILVLGISGGEHAGGDLTDTMMVASFQAQRRELTFISIPRDTWSVTLQDKINSAYHYGEENKIGAGLALSKAITKEVVGLPIHYAFVIDFSGFTKIIDLVGGVDVNVPNAFTDPTFPIEGKENDTCNGDPEFRCRYEALHVDAGVTHMDGALALKYVRSRHAEGEEGSDFARSRRQQDVLVAIKQKIMQPNVFLRPSVAFSLLGAFDEATDTDMNIGELLTVGKLSARIKTDAVVKISFEDLLVSPPSWEYGGRYVLVPREDFDAVHAYIKSKLSR